MHTPAAGCKELRAPDVSPAVNVIHLHRPPRRRARQAAATAVAAAVLAGCGASAAGPTASAPPARPAAAQAVPLPARGVGCAPAAGAAVAGDPVRWTARLDGYAATLTGTWGNASDYPPVVVHPVLSVTGPGRRRSARRRSTVSVLLAPGRAERIPFTFSPAPILPAGEATEGSPLCLVRFQAGRPPAVLMSAGEGGAHDRADPVGVAVSATGVGEPVQDFVAGESDTIVFDGTTPLVETDDGSFTYFYSAFANHRNPPLLLAFEAGTFVDATRLHARLVTGQIPAMWAYWRQNKVFGIPGLDSWVALECVAGHQAFAEAELQALLRRGAFDWGTSYLGVASPGGRPYVEALEERLATAGYCARPPARTG